MVEKHHNTVCLLRGKLEPTAEPLLAMRACLQDLARHLAADSSNTLAWKQRFKEHLLPQECHELVDLCPDLDSFLVHNP